VARILVRDLEDDVKERLQRRARRHGRSMEAEVRAILKAAVLSEEAPPTELGRRLARRFADIGLDAPLAEVRGQAPTPAAWDDHARGPR
jgi:antitoxin FitA